MSALLSMEVLVNLGHGRSSRSSRVLHLLLLVVQTEAFGWLRCLLERLKAFIVAPGK